MACGNIQQQYPGFGGYLPWFKVADDGIHLLQGWLDTVPGKLINKLCNIFIVALDNGQLVWGLIALVPALEKLDPALATRYNSYIKMLIQNAIPIFYEGEGKIRAVTKIKDVKAKPTVENYKSEGFAYWLDDPYEGELYAFFLDLYAPWEQFGFTMNEREKIWIYKVRFKTTNLQ